jgi:hypothetical protein
VTRRRKILDPEKPALCTIHRPSKTASAIVSSLVIQAVHAAGYIPGGPMAGLALAFTAAGVLVMDCVERGE